MYAFQFYTNKGQFVSQVASFYHDEAHAILCFRMYCDEKMCPKSSMEEGCTTGVGGLLFMRHNSGNYKIAKLA